MSEIETSPTTELESPEVDERPLMAEAPLTPEEAKAIHEARLQAAESADAVADQKVGEDEADEADGVETGIIETVVANAAAELDVEQVEEALEAEAEADEGKDEEQQIKVQGELVLKLPDDLYIPPDALQVFLEAFEGPLDLLLYLIKKQNIDILNIPIVEITKQYMEYVDLMCSMQLELAAEYLVMAATLAEIKSRFLLPRQAEEEEDEGEDPRAELIRRLQEYERFKKAAEDINNLHRLGRDLFTAEADAPEMEIERPEPQVALEEIFKAFRAIMSRAKLNTSHQVEREILSIRERMSIILEKTNAEEFTEFSELFTMEEGRMGVVVTFIAILELVRQAALEFVQAEPFAPIYVKARTQL